MGTDAINPDNPVVRLCVAGMEAEMQQRFDDARRLFLQAWNVRTDDYEAAIAAHYVARMEESQEEQFRWNQRALQHAQAVDDVRMQAFYPSLYLNLGWSHELMGDLDQARICYENAADKARLLPSGPYTDTVMNGIQRALKRTSQ